MKILNHAGQEIDKRANCHSCYRAWKRWDGMQCRALDDAQLSKDRRAKRIREWAYENGNKETGYISEWADYCPAYVYWKKVKDLKDEIKEMTE